MTHWEVGLLDPTMIGVVVGVVVVVIVLSIVVSSVASANKPADKVSMKSSNGNGKNKYQSSASGQGKNNYQMVRAKLRLARDAIYSSELTTDDLPDYGQPAGVPRLDPPASQAEEANYFGNQTPEVGSAKEDAAMTGLYTSDMTPYYDGWNAQLYDLRGGMFLSTATPRVSMPA